jgi:hypothetical protein
MNSSPTIDSPVSPPPGQGLRVVDVGRWLWLVTAISLLLGFLLLRELSGVQDVPRVEVPEVLPAEQGMTVESPSQEEGMHTLHPVTSQEMGTPSLDQADSPVSLREPLLDDAWPEFPPRVDTASGDAVVK